MRRHELDSTALVAGIVFALIGVLFVLEGLDVWSLDVRLIAAVLLIGLGTANLTTALRPLGDRHRHRDPRV